MSIEKLFPIWQLCPGGRQCHEGLAYKTQLALSRCGSLREASLVELRDVQKLNGKPVDGGAQPFFVEPSLEAWPLSLLDQKDCVRYTLGPGRDTNRNVYEVNFASLPKSERPLSCVISEGFIGSARCPTSMQIPTN
jgi:hypothetical protein